MGAGDVTLHAQLLAQARHLAARGRQRPQQASLRRSVSTAYYALFHFLADESCRALLGSQRRDHELRVLMSRTFVHTTMKRAAQAFSGGTLPDVIRNVYGPLPIPANLRAVANIFVELQTQRHSADYDLSSRFLRPDVIGLIDRAAAAMAAWRTVRSDRATRLFMLSLLLFDKLQAR
jgi:hypothetical protein